MYESDKYLDAPSTAGQLIVKRRPDVTLRQNIDMQIEQAQERVAELRATKARMEQSGILDMRIDDIQRAMRF